MKPQEKVPMQKQEQCTQEYYIKVGSETSLYQFFILLKSYRSIVDSIVTVSPIGICYREVFP